MFPDIGRTIGQIFGQKKKREDKPFAAMNQGGRGVGVLRNPQPIRPQPIRVQQDPFQLQQRVQQPQQPSTLGQPIKPSNPVNDIGNFLVGNTAKLANTGYAGVQGAVGLGMAALNPNQANQIGTATRQEMDRTLNKGGLFNAGGYFKDSREAANISTPEFGKRFVGAGLGSAGEIAPIGKGVTTAGKITRPGLVKLAGQGATIGGLGSAGSQLTTTGQIDPFETATSAVAGGILAPAGKLVSPLFKPNPPKVSLKTPTNQTPQIPQELQSPVQPSVGMPKTTNDFLDKSLKNIGIDYDKGLVEGNVLYTNPFSKTYNKLQQGYIEKVDAGRDKVAGVLQKGLESSNPVTSGISRIPQIFFKNFGQSDANRQIFDNLSSKTQSGGKVAKLIQDDLDKAVKATGDVQGTHRRIYQVLEEPDFLKRVYGDSTKIGVNDLNPSEKVVMDKLIASNKVRNDAMLAARRITPEQHAQYADGFHSPRIYDLNTNTGVADSPGMIDTRPTKKRQDINTIDEEIIKKTLTDPTLASSSRLETAFKTKATVEALDELADAKLIRDNAPNKNYIKLEGKKYGDYNGKYIDKQALSQIDHKEYFNSDIAQKAGDFMGSYQNSILGKADRINKQVKTVYAPATNIGNISSNILAFSGAANVNSASMAARMAQAGKQLYAHSKKFDPNVYRAEKAGLFSGDTGKQLIGTNDEALKTLTKGSKNPIKKIQSFYGNTDKAAALGLFNELKARGLTDAQAVRRTHKATQNYSNAGRGINLLADTPIAGKPFARFTPELLRIMKNNALYNPLGTSAKIGGLAAGGAALSQATGETTEERQAREGQVGQTGLPFTGGINSLITQGKNKDNVSLNLPIGDSSVNIARASGLNFPIEPGGNPDEALGRQLSPVADMTRKTADGEEVFAPNQTVSSLTFKPIADQLVNRDFMGRQITDPDNKVRSEIGKGKSQYENPDGSRQSPGKDAEQQNRIRHAIQNYAPLANEADAIISAATKKKDYYGKDRTVPQALLRGVGLKTESNAKDVREKRVQNKEFFEGKDKQVKDFLTKNKEVADQYFKFNDSSRDRFTNKKSSALVKPEKWGIVKGETSGKLFKQLQREALDDNKKDGKPVDPIYQLNDPARQKELINLRATPPGEDIEREEILRATSGWYKQFEDAERKYYDEVDKYWAKQPKSKKPADQNDRVKAYGEVKYPEQTDLVKGYYQAKAEDPQKGKDYFKANADALSRDFANYKTAKLENINKKREILGLDPIDQDTFNNVTFGYEEDERKVAKDLYYKGIGSGGGSGGGGSGEPDLGKSNVSYAVSLKSGGQLAKPKVSVKAVKAIVTSKSGISKPKVTLKKGSMKGKKGKA